MEAVIGLFVMLLGVSHAFLQAGETICNITPNSSLCSVPLGGSVSLQLMTNASGRRLDFKKKLPTGFMNVFSLKKGKVTVQEPYRNRTEFLISSGTLKMTKMARNDSGQYSVEVFDGNGINLRNVNVTLDVQDTALPRDGEESGITGSTNLNCNFTSTNKTGTLSPSSDSWGIIRILTAAVCVLAALVLLLVVGVSVVCAQKKKRQNKPKEEDNQELTYSEVRIGPRPGRQMKQRAEEEVEYGEVKFSQRPRHNVEPAADECVYAKMRRER